MPQLNIFVRFETKFEHLIFSLFYNKESKLQYTGLDSKDLIKRVVVVLTMFITNFRYSCDLKIRNMTD